MKKRILASFLSLVLVLSLVPASALAAEEPKQDVDSTVVTEAPTDPSDTGSTEPSGETPVEPPVEEPTEPEAPVCAQLEGCVDGAHDPECPLYVEPEKPAEEPEVPLTDLTPAEPVEEKPAAAEELEADAAPLADDGMFGNCGADGNNVTWTLTVNSDDSSNPTYTLTISGKGDMADYGTQDTPWYSKRQSITQVNLPDGLTRIGKSAFLQTAITNITIPNTVTSIGQNAFWNCNTIKTEIPASVTELGETAFFGTFNVTVSKSNPAYCYENNIIYNKDKTELIQASQHISGAVIIPETVQTIGAYAFYGCTDLTGDLAIPDSVKTIDNAAFYGTGITALTLGKEVQTIGESAFAACTDLTGDLVIPDSVTTIGESAFSRKDPKNTNKISSIQFGKNVKTVGDCAFLGCTNVTSLRLNEGLQEIGRYAFKDLTELTGGLFIPATVTKIGDGAFHGCTKLKGCLTIGGALPQIDGKLLDRVIGEKVTKRFTSVVLREGVTAIGDNAFDNCTSLAEVTIPSTVTQIGDSAFVSTNISTLDLPKGLLEIGTYAFANCKQLEEVVIPDTVKKIGYAAFAYNSNTVKVIIPYTENGIEYTTHQDGHAYVFSTYGDNSRLNTVILGNSPKENGVQTLFANSLKNVNYMVLGAGVQSIGDWMLSEDQNFKGGLYPSTLSTTNDDLSFTSKATKFTLSQGSSITRGDKLEMMQLNKPENGEDVSNHITYSSSDEDVATVDNQGAISAVGAPGNQAIISAMYDGVVFAQITVSVAAKEIAVSMTDKTVTYDEQSHTIKAEAAEGGTLPKDLELVYSYKESNASDNEYIHVAPSHPGVYTVKVESGNPNYELTGTTTATLTISAPPKAQDVSDKVAVTVPSLVYDGKAKLYNAAYEGITDWTIAYYDAEGEKLKSAPVNAGDYWVTINGESENKAVYASITESFTITPAPLTVKAVDKTIRVGDQLPEYTYTVSGWQGNDTDKLLSGVTVTCPTADANKVCDYTITVKGPASIDNYTINYVSGTLTVSRRSSGGSSSSGSSGGDYIVSVDSDKHGTVTVSPKRADKGDTVTITVCPDKGYELDELTVTDKSGDTIKIKDKGNGKFTFTMPGSKVTVEASFKQIDAKPEVPAFVDVPADAYYADAVAWAVKEGITSGTSATTFTPNASCTRAQMVTFLWRANGSPKATGVNPFTDVSADAYYYDAVLWAAEKGITSGTTATTFSPDAVLTRGQTVTFLYRAAGTPAVSGGSFADVDANAYYADAVAWAVSEGITSGTSATTFSPDAACTRGQIVTFLYRDAQ